MREESLRLMEGFASLTRCPEAARLGLRRDLGALRSGPQVSLAWSTGGTHTSPAGGHGPEPPPAPRRVWGQPCTHPLPPPPPPPSSCCGRRAVGLGGQRVGVCHQRGDREEGSWAPGPPCPWPRGSQRLFRGECVWRTCPRSLEPQTQTGLDTAQTSVRRGGPGTACVSRTPPCAKRTPHSRGGARGGSGLWGQLSRAGDWRPRPRRVALWVGASAWPPQGCGLDSRSGCVWQAAGQCLSQVRKMYLCVKMNKRRCSAEVDASSSGACPPVSRGK